MPYRYNTQRLDTNFRTTTTRIKAAVILERGDLCYMNSSGEMDKADATVTATCETMLAIANEYIPAGAEGMFALLGMFDTTGLAIGIVYASTTAGTWSSATPTGTGEIVRVIGYATSATELYFNPDRTWIELV